MEKLRQEIEFVIFLMGGDCGDEIHEELRKHLSELLCMVRNELQCVLTEESWVKDDKGIDSTEKPLGEIVEPYKSVRIVGDEIKQPLTAEELKAGGWWMNSATIEDKSAFVRMGVPVDGYDWENPDFTVTEWFRGKAFLSCSFNVVSSANKNKQIHRIGNNFYHGAP